MKVNNHQWIDTGTAAMACFQRAAFESCALFMCDADGMYYHVMHVLDVYGKDTLLICRCDIPHDTYTMTTLINYLRQLTIQKQVLWCYLLWYFTMCMFYFDPAIRIWLTSLGVSSIIGIALILSISNGKQPRPDRWTIARLFMMPFCVSSFSALVKDHGFILFLSPRWQQDATALGACLIFVACTRVAKKA